VLKVHATGLCDSDVRVERGEKKAAAGVSPGHEMGGEIAECGHHPRERCEPEQKPREAQRLPEGAVVDERGDAAAHHRLADPDGLRELRVGAPAVVAELLGNTPAVARRSYIDPRVFDRYLSGSTIASTLEPIGELDVSDDRVRDRVEKAVLELLS